MDYKQLAVRLRPEVWQGLTDWSRKTRINKTVGVEMAIRAICERDGITIDDEPRQPKDYAE